MTLFAKSHTIIVQPPQGFRLGSRRWPRRELEQGYVVLITILILGAVASVVVGFLLLTGQNSNIASNSVAANAGNKAAANACAQLALSAIATSPNSPLPSSTTQTVSSNQTCSYSISGSSPNFTINVSGIVQQGRRSFTHRLQLTTDQVTPQINVSRWVDVP